MYPEAHRRFLLPDRTSVGQGDRERGFVGFVDMSLNRIYHCTLEHRRRYVRDVAASAIGVVQNLQPFNRRRLNAIDGERWELGDFGARWRDGL